MGLICRPLREVGPSQGKGTEPQLRMRKLRRGCMLKLTRCVQAEGAQAEGQTDGSGDMTQGRPGGLLTLGIGTRQVRRPSHSSPPGQDVSQALKCRSGAPLRSKTAQTGPRPQLSPADRRPGPRGTMQQG